VGDDPVPLGVREEDLGNCDFAFGPEGDKTAYEVGVIKRGSEYHFLFDFWGALGNRLEACIGKEGQHLRAAGDRDGTGRLVQAYAGAIIERQHRMKGREVSRSWNENNELEIRAKEMVRR
jgi:hypothetical protein